MSDLVKRLRNAPVAWKIRHEAADDLDAKDAHIEALEAELAAAKTVNREVLYRENDELRAINDQLRDDVVALSARIEALEAAGKGLAEAMEAIQPEMRHEHDIGDGHFSTEEVKAVETAISAWRAAEGGGDA